MKSIITYAVLACSMVSTISAYVETDYDTPLHAAVRNGNYNKAEVYAKLMPLLINKSAAYGQRPLHLAVRQNNLRCLELLINFDADVDAQDEHKQTPLHYAATTGNKKAIEMLLRAKAKKDIKDEEGYTPFALAFTLGHLEVVALLKV